MANYKPSPNKFINALFGGAQRRAEQRSANEDFENQMANWEDTKMENPYAGVKNPYEGMENVYEDATVNLKAAEFEKEQSQQALANVMQGMRGAAGSSGVAGLAQVLANQGVKQARQASVSISQQEQANQARAMGEAGRLQQLVREGEQKRDLMEREGARMVEQYDMQKQEKMLDIASQRQAAAAQAIDNANAQMDQFVSGALTGVLGGVAQGFAGGGN
tara:strand:- start:1290 stop:1946 length:657 start_codon:yes stop_codon:yes gene_type:complete